MNSNKREGSRFIVGIDLGTTNSVLSYIDTNNPENQGKIEVFSVPQVVAPGEVGEKRQLPSFIYVPTKQEKETGSFVLPWDPFGERVVGEYARRRGAEVPGRLISSAKSWLCHSGIDRTAAILPLDAAEDVQKFSPIVATATFLRHLKAAWNHTIGKRADAPLEEQEVYITIPASFDAVARELTARAAASAGLEDITLLEEPQAAFYAWLHAMGEEWKKQVEPGDIILVVDVGGGTSDFSLIQVGAEEGQLTLERLAVGEHLLLGGDNMDLTLTWRLAEELKAKGTALDSFQFQALWNGVRLAKEKMFAEVPSGEGAPEEVPITIPGRGSSLIGGTIRTSLTRKMCQEVILEGFLPQCRQEDTPVERPRTGLQELGLPYCSDTAITRHLAAFLKAHAPEGGRISHVLFNGGVFKAGVLRQRILEVITAWDSAKDIRPLSGTDLDLAVSIGAAHFGLAGRSDGIRIRSGVPKTYYIGIESAGLAVPGMPPAIKALCIVPKGLEEGSDVELPEKEFGLVVGQKVQFMFLGSNQRPGDKPGDLIGDWQGEIEQVSTLESVMEAPGLEPGTVIPVTLKAKVTEIGTLAVSLVNREKGLEFDLEFNVRQ